MKKPQEIPEEAKKEIEIARALARDSGERFVAAPDKFQFHEYRHMERFIGTLEDPAMAAQLWRAIKGKGAFRYFRDMTDRLGLRQQWLQYRDDAMKEFLIDWAETHNVPFQDDLKRGK